MSYVLQANAEPSKILYIDSRDATNYLATSLGGFSLTSYFQYQLIEKIEVPTNQRALISLNSATIPYSFYNIRENINNKLKCRATNTDSGAFVESTLSLPSANYDAYSFAQTLETFFKTDLQQPVDNITYNIVIDYSTDLQKYNYVFTKFNDAVVSPNMRVDLFFDDTTITQTPHIEMGFREGEARVAMLPASVGGGTFNTTITSDNVIDINGSIHGVYIRTNLVSNGTLDTQSGTFSNILSRVPINVNAGGMIFSTPNNATHKSIVDLRTIDTLTIRLTDERNRILDLNGLHFQIAIAIDFVYAKRKINIPMGSLRLNDHGDSHVDDHEILDRAKSKIKNSSIKK
tara:strand:+ start:695 stop:1732 length:1038 start_codon:yes stop_codon:yes gene_type:complete